LILWSNRLGILLKCGRPVALWIGWDVYLSEQDKGHLLRPQSYPVVLQGNMKESSQNSFWIPVSTFIGLSNHITGFPASTINPIEVITI